MRSPGITLLLLFLALQGQMIAQMVPDRSDPIRDSIQLREVVVTGVVPLNNRHIESFYKANTVATIDNVIGRLDGMSLIRRGSYAMEPSLNGFSGGQVNITIDGMKMFGACTDRMDPITSYIEPSNLKSVTVSQGSGGSHTGCSVGGSVDMSLKEPDLSSERPFYGSVSLGYETVSNGKTLLLSTGYLKNKWQWGLTAAYRKHDSYRDGSNETVPFTQYEKSNFHTVLKYLPDSIQSFKVDVLFDLAHNVGYAALPMDVLKARAFLAAVEYKVKKRADITAKLYYNSILHIMDDSKRDSAYYVTNSTTGETEKVYMRMDMPGTSSTLGAYVQAVFRPGRRNTLTVQADNYTNHSLAEMTMYMHYPDEPPEAPMYLQTWPDIMRNVTGLFVQNTWNATTRFRLGASGRVDYNLSFLLSDLAREQFSVFNIYVADSYHEPVASINITAQYTPSGPWSVKAETGYSGRMPTISEQFGFYLYNAYDGYDYIGNPDIRPEKSFYGRFSVQYFKARFKFNLSQSAYSVHDYIMGLNDPDIPPMNFNTNGTRVYSNVSSAALYNTNLQIQAVPFRGLSVFMLTKYTWGQLYTGDPLPLIPPLNNVIAVSYQRTRWGCSLENETAAAQNRINTGYGEISSPAYTVFNIKGSYRFRLPGSVNLDCSLAVTNIFNAKYYEHLDWGEIYRPGRSFDVLVRFSF